MKRGLSVFLLLAATTSTAVAADRIVLSLEEALQIAGTQNIDLTLARLNLEELRSQYLQAIALGLPHASLEGTALRYDKKPAAFMGSMKIETSRENVLQSAVAVRQPIFQGGQIVSSVKAARHALAAGSDAVQDTEQAVIQTVKSLFYAALLSSSTARIQADNLASTQRHLDTIRERYRQGLDSDLTLQRQEVEVADAKAGFLSANNLREMALISLQETLMLDINRPLDVRGDLAIPATQPLAYEDLVRLAMERHPGLRRARHQSSFFDYRARLTRAEFSPNLSLIGQWGWRAESEDSSFSSSESASSLGGGVALSYPIFTGGDRLQRVRQASIDVRRSREQEREVERAIRVDVRRQWLNVMEALERARSQETAIAQAVNALHATEIRYKSGQASLLDLNDATFALNQIRTRHAQAAHDYWVSLAALERAVGGTLPGDNP